MTERATQLTFGLKSKKKATVDFRGGEITFDIALLLTRQADDRPSLSKGL